MPLWAAAKGDRSVGEVSGCSHDIGNMYSFTRARAALPAVRQPKRNTPSSLVGFGVQRI